MMPESRVALPVAGVVANDSAGLTLVLSERLDGHDTFLTGQLAVDGADPMPVRILTFDDVTVLRLIAGAPVQVSGSWSGVLHLPHGWRARSLPTDLSDAALDAHRDLMSLDDAELRYALTFLGEASTAAIRQARIDLILSALPQLSEAT
jgi:hypothetical protein